MLELAREKLQRGIHAVREPLISAESPYPFDGAGRPEKPFECEGFLPCGAADKYGAGAVHRQVPASGTLSTAVEAEFRLAPTGSKIPAGENIGKNLGNVGIVQQEENFVVKCPQTELIRAAFTRKGHHSDLFKLQLGGTRRRSQIDFSSNYTDDSARPPRLTVFEQLKSIKV